MKRILTLLFLLSISYINSSAQEFQWAKELIHNSNSGSIDKVVTDNLNNVYIVGTFKGELKIPLKPEIIMESEGWNSTFVMKFDASGNYIWGTQFCSEDSYGSAIAVDDEQNVYVAGRFKGDISFGCSDFNHKTATISGNYDIYIVQLDKDGKYAWSKQLEGFGEKHVTALEVDQQKSVYLGGFFDGGIDLDPDFNGTQFYQASYLQSFLVKLQNRGTFAWGTSYTGKTRIWSIAVGDDGSVYTTGEYWAQAIFDPLTNLFRREAVEVGDAFLVKHTSYGKVLWVRNFAYPGDGWISGHSINVDKFGSLVMTGVFYGTMDLDFGPGIDYFSSNDNPFSFVIKLNNSGEVSWAETIVPSLPNVLLMLNNVAELDEQGNIYIAGTFWELYKEVTGGEEEEEYLFWADTIAHNYMVKLGPNGNKLNDIRFSGIINNDIALDNSGGAYMTGIAKGDLDPSEGIFAVDGTYLLKIGPEQSRVPDPLDFPVTAYPNPTDGNVTIMLDPRDTQITDFTVTVINALGQTITDPQIIDNYSNWANLDIEGPPGFYFVEIESKDSKKVKSVKIVKR